MIVHDFDVFSQNAKNIVCLNALHVLVLMSGVIGNALISVEAEAGSLLEDEDNSIIPVNQASADENVLKINAEPAKRLGCARLELRYISLTGRESSSGNAGKEHGCLVHGRVDSIREGQEQGLQGAAILRLFLKVRRYQRTEDFPALLAYVVEEPVLLPDHFDLYIVFVLYLRLACRNAVSRAASGTAAAIRKRMVNRISNFRIRHWLKG